MIIAIDGPAGSGKSTVARRLAEQLGFLYVDTGAMYRAVTLKALNEGVNLNDSDVLIALSKCARIELKYEDKKLYVFLDGEDVSVRIRENGVTNKVAFLARIPEVRVYMAELQRKLGRQQDSVLEGRDIGTVVFPNADLKFYIDAGVDERAMRRFKELSAVGADVEFEQVKEEAAARDESDKNRDVAPLRKADDAVYIDTTDMSIDEVVERMAEEIQRAV